MVASQLRCRRTAVCLAAPRADRIFPGGGARKSPHIRRVPGPSDLAVKSTLSQLRPLAEWETPKMRDTTDSSPTSVDGERVSDAALDDLEIAIQVTDAELAQLDALIGLTPRRSELRVAHTVAVRQVRWLQRNLRSLVRLRASARRRPVLVGRACVPHRGRGRSGRPVGTGAARRVALAPAANLANLNRH